MRIIESIAELEALYGVTAQGAIDKVCDHITPLYRRWIDASRFVVLSTVGPEGTDASPRGDPFAIVVGGRSGSRLKSKNDFDAGLARQQSPRFSEKHRA